MFQYVDCIRWTVRMTESINHKLSCKSLCEHHHLACVLTIKFINDFIIIWIANQSKTIDSFTPSLILAENDAHHLYQLIHTCDSWSVYCKPMSSVDSRHFRFHSLIQEFDIIVSFIFKLIKFLLFFAFSSPFSSFFFFFHVTGGEAVFINWYGVNY